MYYVRRVFLIRETTTTTCSTGPARPPECLQAAPGRDADRVDCVYGAQSLRGQSVRR